MMKTEKQIRERITEIENILGKSLRFTREEKRMAREKLILLWVLDERDDKKIAPQKDE
jgi:hypothetical protein